MNAGKETGINDIVGFAINYGIFVTLYSIGLMGADPGLLTAMFFSPKKASGKILLINIEPRAKETRDEINKIWKALLEFEAEIHNADITSAM